MITKPRPGRPDILDIVGDPTASTWLKNAARSAMNRDPVDAANDAAFLYRWLDRRAQDTHQMHQLIPPTPTVDTVLAASGRGRCPDCERVNALLDLHPETGKCPDCHKNEQGARS